MDVVLPPNCIKCDINCDLLHHSVTINGTAPLTTHFGYNLAFHQITVISEV